MNYSWLYQNYEPTVTLSSFAKSGSTYSGKWVIYGTEYHTNKQLPSLKHHWTSYPSWVYKPDKKKSTEASSIQCSQGKPEDSL